MKKYRKNLRREIEFINFFNKLEDKPYCFCKDNTQHVIYKEKDKFILEMTKGIEAPTSEFKFQNINNNKITIGTLEILILNSFIKSSNFFDNTKFEINSFCDINFNKNKKMYYKLIIPYEEDIKLRYENIFSRNLLITINEKIFSGIQFKINDIIFQIYNINNYFIVESLDKINFEYFNKISRDVLAVFGFFSGFVPLDKGYFFDYENQNISFSNFIYKNDFINTYIGDNLVTTNIYDFYQNEDIINDTENISSKVKPIDNKHFLNLLHNILSNENFSAVIYSYLNISNKTNNIALNIKCASYAIILEMLTNIISEENKEKLYFIKDKRLRKNLQKFLLEKAKEFFKKNNLENFENSPIKKKLENINSPTNRDKLLKPFEILNIPLNDNEKTIINSRNDFLHGNNIVEGLDFLEQSKKLFYLSLEFNYLVYALILKYIGYDGIVKNLPKIYLDHYQLPELEKEKYYKDLSI